MLTSANLAVLLRALLPHRCRLDASTGYGNLKEVKYYFNNLINSSVGISASFNIALTVPRAISSGADITPIPLTFGRLLGLELKKEEIKHLRGIGGVGVPVVIKETDMRINGTEFPVRIAWALEEDLSPLLERVDIFDDSRSRLISAKKS